MAPHFYNAYRQPLGETTGNTNSSNTLSKAEGDTFRSWLASKTRFRVEPVLPAASISAVTADVTPARAFPQRDQVRAVVLAVHADSSLLAVLTQSCGGPLERVARTPDGTAIILEFLHAQNAAKFLRYVNEGHCVVNGEVLSAQSAAPSLAPESADADARRTLRLWRSTGYYSGQTHLGLNLDRLKATFGRTGTLVAIQPMFAKKYIAFAVHFDSIGSASRAKHLFDHSSSLFADFSPNWHLDYDRDPVDRPCIFI